MDIFGNQESDFCRLDVPQLHVCKKNEVKERSSIQEELEPSINKEEEEELRSNPEEEEQDIKPDKILIIQVEEKHICKEETDDEQLLWKQERSSNLDEEEPELQHIKAEQEEYFISEGGELLEQKQETDAFTVTGHDQERMDYKPSESPDLEENTPIRNIHHFEHLGNSSTLENHCQIDIEEVLDVLKCSVCGKTFTQSYLNHSQVKQLDVIHSGVTLGLCEPCRNRLDQGDAVTIQLDTPSDKRSHSCKVCGKVFMGRDVPQLHVPEDEEERSFLDQDQPEPPQIKEEEEEELSSSQEEEHLLLKQEIKSERDELYVIQFEDPSEKHIYKEETDDEQQLLWKQERRSSLGEEEPELPEIKEEWEEVYIIEEGEQLELKQENDAFMLTEHDQEKMDSETEPSESAVLEKNNQIKNSDAVTVQLNPSSNESLHWCGTCGKVFTRRRNLSVHMRIHTRERPLCEICKKTFCHAESLLHHMRTHTGERPFTCPLCEKGFIRRCQLQVHLRTHTGARPYTCEVCQKTYINSSHFKVHMRTHTGERLFTCEVCEKSFTTTAQLKVHMRTHTGEKPFTCEVCEKSFAQICQLNVHMRTHTGERPFSCEICEKRFTKSIHLKVHMRVHTGERPYTCQTCGKSYAQSSYLIVHMRGHTGERPYICKICGRSYTQSSKLSVHMKKSHA